MLLINVKRVFEARGITNAYSHLVKLGISRPTAWNLLDSNTSMIKAKYLELICEYLNCEPNDLYEWRPGKNVVNPETHPLKGLRRAGDAQRVSQLMHEVPLNKLAKVEELLSSLANEV